MSNETALATFKGLSTLLRPRYTRGLLLEDDDLTTAVEYTRNATRLLFRSLFGCGVICGLKVRARVKCHSRQLQVTVAKGVALDCLGNPIEVTGSQSLLIDAGCDDKLPAEVWVSICYLEKNCRPRDVSCSPDEDSQVVQTRSHDGFEIRLHAQQPAGSCSCAPPATGNGGAARTSSKCCGESGAAPSAGRVTAAETPFDPCACYDDHDAGECGCDCDCSCVVLAKISIEPHRYYDENAELDPDHTVRRFIRPQLLGKVQCQPEPPSLPDQLRDVQQGTVAATPAAQPDAEVKGETKGEVQDPVDGKGTKETKDAGTETKDTKSEAKAEVKAVKPKQPGKG